MASSSGEGSGQLVEVFVQGVLDGGKLEALRDRLDALCDGAPDAATPFDYIERIYNSGKGRGWRGACEEEERRGKGEETFFFLSLSLSSPPPPASIRQYPSCIQDEIEAQARHESDRKKRSFGRFIALFYISPTSFLCIPNRTGGAK